MTNRERVRAILTTQNADRIPVVAFGYWEPDGVASIEFQCFLFSDYNYLIKK